MHVFAVSVHYVEVGGHDYQGSSKGPGLLAHSLPITSSAFPIPLAPSTSSQK